MEESLYGDQGSGYWEFVVTTAGGLGYVVAAKAEGYVSPPESYIIRIIGDKAHVLENSEIGEEAMRLDYYFTLIQ